MRNAADAHTPAGKTHVVRFGKPTGEAVVRLHAIGLDASFWTPQIDRLASDFDVIAYDIRGHGRSAPLGARLDFSGLVDDLQRVLEASGKDSAHLVGLSLGGMIAQHAAVLRPRIARSLTLIDTASTLSDAAREAVRLRAKTVREGGMAAILGPTIARWFTPAFLRSRPEIVGRVSRALLAADAETHARFWDLIATLDIADRLHEIDCPTLVVVGEDDPTTPVAAARLIANRIAGSRMEVLPGLSHMVPLEAPDRTGEILTSFLSAR